MPLSFAFLVVVEMLDALTKDLLFSRLLAVNTSCIIAFKGQRMSRNVEV